MPKRFTMDAYYAQMEEIRQRVRQKPITSPNILERLRQVKRPQLPRMPKLLRQPVLKRPPLPKV